MSATKTDPQSISAPQQRPVGLTATTAQRGRPKREPFWTLRCFSLAVLGQATQDHGLRSTYRCRLRSHKTSEGVGVLAQLPRFQNKRQTWEAIKLHYFSSIFHKYISWRIDEKSRVFTISLCILRNLGSERTPHPQVLRRYTEHRSPHDSGCVSVDKEKRVDEDFTRTRRTNSQG